MKKIGFIRWKGFIPFVVITVLFYVFATFFLDSFLKKLIEKNATHLNGALVEMKSFRLSFLQSSLKIKNLEITNPNNLMQNRAELGNITLDFRFLPLLKKKFVAEELRVTDVRWLTKRKYEGKIPLSWQREWEADKEKELFLTPFLSEAMQNLTKTIKSELPDISVDSLKKKFDPREAIKVEELTSYKKVFEVKDKAEGTYKKWDGDTKQIVEDQKKFASNIKSKIASLNPNNMNNPQAIFDAINTVSSFEKDIKSQKELVTGKIKEATTEVKGLTGELKNIPDLIKGDVQSIVDKYSFGSLSIENFSKQIFGMQWIPYFQKYVQYSSMVKQYMKKYQATKKDEKPKPQRFKGVDIAFPITDNTPKFLVQKIDLSVQTGEKEKENEFYRGKYELKILDISSDQKLYGKPTTADLTLDTYDGPFAKGFLNLLIDHRDEPTKDQLKLGIQNFKLAGHTLGQGSVFPLPLKGGFADAHISGGIIGDKTTFGVKLDIKDALYQFEKSSNYLITLLQDIVEKINKFYVEINFFGTLHDPKFTIRSSLDDAIASGIKKVFMEKLAEVKEKAEKYIREEVMKNLDKAKGQIALLENNVSKLLGDQLKSVDLLSGDVKSKIDALKKRQQSLLMEKANIPGKSEAEKKIKGFFGK